MFGWTRPDHRDTYAFLDIGEDRDLKAGALEGVLIDLQNPNDEMTLYLSIESISNDIEKDFSGSSCSMRISPSSYQKILETGCIAIRDGLGDHLAVMRSLYALTHPVFRGYMINTKEVYQARYEK